MTRKQRKMLIRVIATTILLIILAFAPIPEPIAPLAYLLPFLLIGYDILIKAFKGIARRQVFDENFLMAVATAGAFALGEYREGVAVMLFYQIGELFQSYAVGRSRRSIGALMDVRPDWANIEKDGTLERVDPEEVEPGTCIVVQPGEKIPIDGVVEEGVSTLDTVALTGESVPRTARVGDEVLSGCICLNGVLKIRTTRPFGESTVSRVLELVENASSQKSRSENFITRFARYYTPAVCAAALALAVLPPLIRAILGLPPQIGSWVYRALTFLVISCPCALVISIPLTFFAGIGGASREGILVKGSNYLETLAKAKIAVFDKTGTMTRGVFEVQGVHHNTLPEGRLIELAALAECASPHPISRSLMDAYGKNIDRTRVRDIKELTGEGVLATVDGIRVAAGNRRLMERVGVLNAVDCSQIGSVVHISLDGVYAGHILIADVLRPTTREAIRALHANGVEKTVMLTGDDRRVAEQVASTCGLSACYGELLPQEKVAMVEQMLQEKPAGSALLFVGDGINDAPVLSRADVGIAMGALGSDAAIEAADVVLMDDDPLRVVKAIRIARKCMGIVRQNIVFAIGVKLVCLALGALGYANMWLAVFADVGVMVLAVLNAIRALRTRTL